jgi:hypothetical protein
VKVSRLQPEFVEFIPEVLEDGKLYISEEYATAVHKCCCGCGLKVVTPLKRTEWKLTRDGQFVTLNPSIGNWSFPCQSHYWIRRNAIKWSYQMTKEEIEAGRRYDVKLKQGFSETGEFTTEDEFVDPAESTEDQPKPTESLWQTLKKLFRG